MATSYDGDLQMFREPGREPDLSVLLFLRWLAERGELEHELSGASSGELVNVVEPVHGPTQAAHEAARQPERLRAA